MSYAKMFTVKDDQSAFLDLLRSKNLGALLSSHAISSGSSKVNGKVVGGYATFANGLTIRVANGRMQVCTNGGSSCQQINI